ncbi:uncharacterized protein LOC110827867 [Zootermopsis nevadensis]|uniref:uncharacterized protein LOC110827867 n=1 Tax=Zootermopsis nevadensis TaxID=136037 RepID=UPI000B8E9C05|nr:uncharacterized protein LOC110827867 [Zootermopsis nevadensis]
MSGVGFLAAVKTFTPSARRRRRSEKQLQRLELPGTESSTAQQVTHPDVVPTWDVAPPITPPAAFLPANHRKNKSSAPVVVATVYGGAELQEMDSSLNIGGTDL